MNLTFPSLNYPKFSPPDWIKDNELINKLEYLWNISIDEIEDNDETLSSIINEICLILGPLDTDDKEYTAMFHRRYIHLLLSIVRNVNLTIYHYSPYSTLPSLIEHKILLFLNKGKTPDMN